MTASTVLLLCFAGGMFLSSLAFCIIIVANKYGERDKLIAWYKNKILGGK